MAQRKRADGPLNEAEHILKRGMVAFTREQEQLRREEQRRREKAARREEEGRRLAEAAALELEAEATGDTELAAEAEALVEAPIDVAPVFVEPTTPKAAGVSYRTTYKARVTNFSTFLSAVTANPQYHDLVTVNQGALNGLARSLKQRLDIPGVVVDVEQVAAVRGQ